MTPKELELYKSNAVLINLLIHLVFKSLSRKDSYAENVTLHPRPNSLEEAALQTLVQAGFARTCDEGYTVEWQKLRGRLENASVARADAHL